ncbi:transporter substrate-binding domain-containing protein [Streptomyces pratensis]|uniref:transporter substrate-binding domain-containing protein n=1 Tax=Streptomyces pratensis TaxID=1169025 RepID=UPI0030184C0D
MAVACAVTAAVTLLPLARHSGGPAGAGPAGGPAAVQARADACTEPEVIPPASGGGGPSIDRIKKRGKLVAGVDQNSFRWGYRDPETRRLGGFDIDLVRAIAEDALDGTEQDPDVLTVPNQLDCLARLQLGEVDAIVTDNALAAGQAAQDPTVELKGKAPFTTEYYGVGAKKGADDLAARVNKVLADYRAGGAKSDWTAAYDTWLARVLPGMTAPPVPEYRSD